MPARAKKFGSCGVRLDIQSYHRLETLNEEQKSICEVVTKHKIKKFGNWWTFLVSSH